jgi:hypothetical protein
MFLITFFGCVRVLVWSDGRLKPHSKINYKMLVAALLMFIFASMDVAFGLQHNIDAFIYFDGDPIDEFSDTSNWINVMKMVNYVAQTFIGDCILVGLRFLPLSSIDVKNRDSYIDVGSYTARITTL